MVHMRQRFIHIDIAKGIGILFIVFSHNWILANYKGELIQVAYSFPVVMFTALSGIFFNAGLPFLKTLIQKADSLIKPYFATLIIVELLFHLFTVQEKSLGESFFGILYGTGNLLRYPALWFLPNLFVVTIFAWLYINILKLDRSKTILNFIILSIMLAVGVYFIREFWGVIFTINGKPLKRFDLPFSKLWGLPFGIDVVFITGFYFILGYVLRPAIESIKFNIVGFMTCLIAFILLNYFSTDVMDINIRKYGSLIPTTAIALLGIYLTLSFSVLISHFGKAASALTLLGENSLAVYLFHTSLQEYTFSILNVVGSYKTLNALIAYAVGIIIPLLLVQIIKRIWVLRILLLPIQRAKN